MRRVVMTLSTLTARRHAPHVQDLDAGDNRASGCVPVRAHMSGVGAAFAVGHVSNGKEVVAATMVANEWWRRPSELKAHCQWWVETGHGV
jgi:hypothetical protein